METCELAIIGLGAAGSAALLAAARDGVDVIGFDRFAPPHDRGSTHGETRIVRAAIGEGVAYSPLALRSFDLWEHLEAETGESLVTRCGALILGGVPHATHAKIDFIATTLAAARQYAIPHEMLAASRVRARFPAYAAFDGEQAYFEPGAGFARPEAIVAAQLNRARALGARAKLNTVVQAVAQEGGGVRVRTAEGDVRAARAIICAGAWVKHFLPDETAAPLRVLRQTMHWFDLPPHARAQCEPGAMPVFIWDELYGFPLASHAGAGLKVATENMQGDTDPDAVARAITPGDIAIATRHAHARFPFLGAHQRGVSCLYTVAPDSNFRIGPHPRMERVLVASACSGHGFKHSAAIGEALVRDPAALASWAWPTP